jgi:uncharacterized damage-inducible protein DinB
MRDEENRLATCEAIAAELTASFGDLCFTLHLLDAEEIETAQVSEGWTPKALLAHVAFWDAFQQERMEAALVGQSVQDYARPDHDNDTRAQADAAREWEEVIEAAQKARQRLVDFALELDDAVLAQDFPEGAQRFSIGKQLRHMVRHTHLHDHQVRCYCGSMQRWDRAGLRAFVAAQHKTLMDGIAGLTEATLLSEQVCGHWTIRETLAHVLSWNEHAYRLLSGWPHPAPEEIAEWPDEMNMDKLNEHLLAARADLDMIGIADGLMTYYRRLLRLYDAATDAELSSMGRTWLGTAAMSVQFYEMAIHELEHAEDIWRFRAAETGK